MLDLNRSAKGTSRLPSGSTERVIPQAGGDLALASFSSASHGFSRSVPTSPTSEAISEPELSFLRRPWQTIKYLLFVEPVEKPTGLEKLSLDELLRLKEKKGAFEFARTEEVFLRAPWSQLLSSDLLEDPQASEWKNHLMSKLKDSHVIELGAFNNGATHEAKLRESFKIRQYTAVDQQEVVKEAGGVQEDMLSFLAKQPNSSAHIMANGVFNEPLSLQYGESSGFRRAARDVSNPAKGHVEHEYVRRLVSEILRVLPEGGLFFGNGIHSGGTESDIEFYLTKAGLVSDLKSYELLTMSLSFRYSVDDPFFVARK